MRKSVPKSVCLRIEVLLVFFCQRIRPIFKIICQVILYHMIIFYLGQPRVWDLYQRRLRISQNCGIIISWISGSFFKLTDEPSEMRYVFKKFLKQNNLRKKLNKSFRKFTWFPFSITYRDVVPFRTFLYIMMW